MCGWGEVEDAESGAKPGANAAFPRFNNARPACADESRGERGGFCMGFVPASSRDRLTWTGNESRGIINAEKSMALGM